MRSSEVMKLWPSDYAQSSPFGTLGAVIIFLDTTVLLSDVAFHGVAWRVLAQAAPAWDVQILVPEVAIVEAVAGYDRRVREAHVGLDRWGTKHSGALGQAGTHAKLAAELALIEGSSSYSTQLHSALADLSVQIIPPVEVPHLELVHRAASRRRPCNSNGDGYRDTLNWLTLLNVAAQHPDEPLALISDNSADFGADDGVNLHGDLKADLAPIHAVDRVTWFRNLQELVLFLAAEHALGITADLQLLQEKLHSRLLRDYINDNILAKAVEMDLNPRRCGLPAAAVSARLESVGDIRSPILTVRGTASESEPVVEFSFEAETSIVIQLPPDVISEDPALRMLQHGISGSGAVTTKSLRYSGLITLDSFGRPTGGELTRVIAREDDPGRMALVFGDSMRTQTHISASKRPGSPTVKVGQSELSLQEMSEKLLATTADIQGRLAALASDRNSAPPEAAGEETAKRLQKVIWVDDIPSNIAYEVAQLEALGVQVEQATSTEDALAQISDDLTSFDAVVSDMGRDEHEAYKPQAGLELIERLRGLSYSGPIFIYTNRRGLMRRREIIMAGGNGVTSSVSELFSYLRSAGSFPTATES